MKRSFKNFWFMVPMIAIFLACCAGALNSSNQVAVPLMVDTKGTNLQERILVPEGYSRVTCDSSSFGFYLRHLKMKPDSSEVMLFDGQVKPYKVHAAVIDLEIGKRDLQQCADACIRLRAEYLRHVGKYSSIHFNLTNGFRMDYSKWKGGYRLQVNGNKTSWVKSATADDSYASFRKYLDIVFTYAGTLSVEKEIKAVALKDIQPGDIFVVGGSPGHASMVADVAQNAKGEKIFLLCQGYMPAQDIHVILNPNDKALSPWYSLGEGEALETMEWRFGEYTLGRFE
jgi:hypothetical protein